MMRGLYSLVLNAARPLLKRKLRKRGMAEPGYLQHMEERFGRYAQATQGGRLWLHAVSLGETRAAATLIAALRAADPSTRILLTHGTATGRAEGERLLGPDDAQAWLPWDTPQAVRRFLDHFQPSAGVLLETEVWPNLVAACQARGIPLALANARLNAKSFAKAHWLAWIARPTFGALAAVWAQSDADAARLVQLGAPVRGVFGNLKFDATPNAQLLAMGRQWRRGLDRPVVLLASSREGEEAALMRSLGAWPQVQWLLVPRHPHRFDEVAAMAHDAGLALSRRSAWPGAPATGPLWLGDTLGEMALYYGLADVALLGGSFAPLGGQNLIEAASCGCPVVMGPHTFNFLEAAELSQAAGAAQRATGLEPALAAAVQLAQDAEARRAASHAALAFAGAHRGAGDKTAAAVLGLVRSAGR